MELIRTILKDYSGGLTIQLWNAVRGLNSTDLEFEVSFGVSFEVSFLFFEFVWFCLIWSIVGVFGVNGRFIGVLELLLLSPINSPLKLNVLTKLTSKLTFTPKLTSNSRSINTRVVTPGFPKISFRYLGNTFSFDFCKITQFFELIW